MSDNNYKETINKCLQMIEDQLGWGAGDRWSTHDFEMLGERILEKTGIQLSVITLKRLWGRISYENRPTTTTLNALAQYLDFENWRSFEVAMQNKTEAPQEITLEKTTPSKITPDNKLLWFLAGALSLISAIFLIYLGSGEVQAEKPIDPDLYQFSSKKTVDKGVPNSVIFQYNALAAEDSDSVFIQQSWDPGLRKLVDPKSFYHTSIYYYPGFFRARLIVRDSIVKSHNIIIHSDGWLPVIEREGVPVYLKPDDAMAEPGILTIPRDSILARNIELQPEVPWVSFHYIRDFIGLTTDNFVFETSVKHIYNEGSAICQHTEIYIQYKTGIFMIPLSVDGCVSSLRIFDMDGEMDADLSGLGVDFDQWVKVRIEVENQMGKLFINDQLVLHLNYKIEPLEILGVRYRFKGTGSVDYVKFYNGQNQLVYSEDFDQ